MAISRKISSRGMVKQLTNNEVNNGGGGSSSGGGWTVYSQNITAGGQISLASGDNQQLIIVTGSGGAVSTASLAFSGTIANGSMVRVMGGDNTNTVTISNNDTNSGTIMNGNAVLRQYYTIDFQWNTTQGRFVETGRNF